MSSFALIQTTILEDNDEMEAIEDCGNDLATTNDQQTAMESNQISDCCEQSLIVDITDQQCCAKYLEQQVNSNQRMSYKKTQ